MMPTAWALAWLVVVVGSGPPTGSVEQVQKWIAELSDPSFERRQAAVEQLYGAGPKVLDDLTAVLTGNDAEAALRAQLLIERIGRLYLVGATVHLAVDPPAAAWNEPVAVRVDIVNTQDFPIHLPFLTSDRQTLDVDRNAVQVGAVLDVADFLEVIGPDGKRIDLMIDDYRGFRGVEHAVDARVHLEPVSDLPAGQRFRLQIPAFNRGPARWRLLEAGTYRIRFHYIPEWEEPDLIAARTGEIISNEIRVEITEAAPAIIDRGSRIITARVESMGDTCIASLRSTHDRPITVNLNIGGHGDRLLAQLQWRVQRFSPDTAVVGEPVIVVREASPNRIVLLEPGESVEIHRASIAALSAQHPGPGRLRISARYTNLFDRTRDVPAGDRSAACIKKLGMPTFVGSIYSDPIEAPDPRPTPAPLP